MRRALLLATLIAGCTFPDPAIDETLKDSSPFDVSFDSNVGETALVADSAADSKPSTCETGNECDCDGDGDQAIRTGCAGNDCDDGDKRRNSKVTEYQSYDATGTTHGGDWDCDNNVVRELGDKAVSCTGLALGSCAGVQGYTVDKPACGSTVDVVRCKSNGVTCSVDITTKLTVKCK